MGQFNFLVSVLLVTLFSSHWSCSSAQATGTIVPLYLWPTYNQGVHNWQPLIDAKKAHPNVPVWAIVNVNSGPGTEVSQEYKDAINKLIANDIKVMGYVYTRYGKRDPAEVQAEVDRWQQFYTPEIITGIFFDEMSYEVTSRRNGKRGRDQKETTVTYYDNLNKYAKSHGIKYTVGNPGTDTKEDFVNTVDTIIIFETDTGFPSETQYGGWHSKYPKEKWGILPYNIKNLEQNKVKDAQKFVGYIFVTDDVLPNPWDTLPNYLTTLFSYLTNP